MATVAHLDTHVVLWLYSGDVALLSDGARDAVEMHDCAISPMAALEIRFLHEIGRLIHDPMRVLRSLAASIGLQIDDRPIASVVEEAHELAWTRDPFDRLITAHVRLLGVPLVTRDRAIRSNYARALW